jgi:hypothetical protein
MIRSFLLPVLLSGAVFAQVGGPILGYVPDGSTIRPMYGLPAAGAIGAEIAEGGWAQIAISPAQNFVVATHADNGEVLLVNLVQPSVTSISGASASPDILAISPSGTSAALWFQSTGHLQTITGLPNSPVLRDIDASFLHASASGIAVSDDGQWTVALFSTGLYAFGPTAQVIPLQTDPGILAVAFFHTNHTLALATAARATSITDVGGANQPSVLFDYSQQSLSPRALAVSFDNSQAVIADSTGKVVNINVAASTANIVDCGCSPAGVFPLGGSVFRLTGVPGPARNALERSGSRPDLKVFDASAGAVWIVPPALSAKGGRQ